MKNVKARKAWIKEHINDYFVKQAKKEGYRSRAAYKLIEIAERDHLLRPGMTVVDLGAAPGSWSQVVTEKLAGKGRVVALDLLEMAPLPGVTFLQGNFEDADILVQLEQTLGTHPVDLVICDMSPNISGIPVSDQARSMHLAELALGFCVERLNYGGSFLVKVFQGSGFEQYHGTMRNIFRKVVTRKPDASRGRSSEIYLVGIEKRDNGTISDA